MDRPPIRFSWRTACEAIRVARQDHQALYDYVKCGVKTSVINQLARIFTHTGLPYCNIISAWSDITLETEWYKWLEGCIKGKNYGQVVVPEMLYMMVRRLKPAIFVETGVAAGVSSAYILKAMQDNNYGHLYSIDYPDHMVEGQKVPQTGCAIHPSLKDRWSLMIGRSVDLLDDVVGSLEKVDIFMHDSEHTHNNMLWEMETAWRNMPDKGLILCHDINDNMAFRAFADEVKHPYHEIFFTGMGLIVK